MGQPFIFTTLLRVRERSHCKFILVFNGRFLNGPQPSLNAIAFKHTLGTHEKSQTQMSDRYLSTDIGQQVVKGGKYREICDRILSSSNNPIIFPITESFLLVDIFK